MIEDGSRVKLRPGSTVARQHTGLVDAVGIVGAIVHAAPELPET